jgi:hypothetical protein
MKCSASPTISTGVKGITSLDKVGNDVGALRQAQGDVVKAILFREILAPLTRGLGPVGEIVLGNAVDSLFVRRAR